MNEKTPVDVLVVGGGLAGLAAAAYAARAGRSVLVLERSADLGGRAQTQDLGGFRFNLGPHALYNNAAGMEVLRDLGVPFVGKPPRAAGGLVVRAGRLHRLPGGPASLLATGALRTGEKFAFGGLLARIPKLDLAPLGGTTLDAWLRANAPAPGVRAMIEALVRLATYTNDPARASAGAALGNLRHAILHNVLYLDGGWATLVEGLQRVAADAGAKIAVTTRAEAVEPGDGLDPRGPLWRVRTAEGGTHLARWVILAVPPRTAAELVAGEGARVLGRWAEDCAPVQAACLDLALTGLPVPARRFALGLDAPTYFSVHSFYGKLAPEGGAVVQVAKYLAPGGRADAQAVERELEALADLVQPGWRERVAHRRYLPAMTVTHALVTAGMVGLAGRPGPAVPGARGLFVAGDWVGPRGMLADAALASARQAAAAIVEDLRS